LSAPTPIDRFRGALLGLATGDALGTTLEFKPPGSFAPLSDIVGGGPFGLRPGQWTDDTSMAMCLAESLVERREFDPIDQLERYLRWYRDGHWSSTSRCFDIGNATRSALTRFEADRSCSFPGDADPGAGGNGPLMKLAPVPMAFAADPERAVKRASDSARTTHGLPAALDATAYFAGLLVGALRGAPREVLLADGAPNEPFPGAWSGDGALHREVDAIARGSFLHREPPQIKGGGYAVHALEAALWAVARNATFEGTVLDAANLGDDADTTAAIAGQLAGALYGIDGIPARWRELVHRGDEIVAMADALYALAAAAAVPERDGPLPGDAFWVREGRLLAGPHPAAASSAEAREKLEAFVDLGVTTFIDLTEAEEGLAPYAETVVAIAAERGRSVTHRRFAIRDVDVPTAELMREALDAIDTALAAGELVYVHCWGGVGRTGTVLGCHLLEGGCDRERVLDELAAMRAGTARASRTSPETSAQRAFVLGWEDD